jgi:hypothetical protein
VLHDFQIVLDYVGLQGVKAAGKYNLLPLEAIGELDQRFSRPLRLELKRPQLRSHPYLQGLHLLLRASGLGRTEGTGAKARLTVDPGMLEQWQGLNPTERYFNLLEAWLLLSRPEMVGERGSWLRMDSLGPVLEMWQTIPAGAKKFDLKQPVHVYVSGIGREFYHLALADLFGLMAVDLPQPPVQPWAPAAIKHLPFGDAALSLLRNQVLLPWEGEGLEEDADEEEPTGPPWFGEWQPLFQPYFPEWRNNLVVPEAEVCEGTFVFKVSLGKVWRRIAMPSDASLDDLVHWILRSVDFDSDHLYAFAYRDHFGASVRAEHPFCDGEGPSADDVLIGELPLEPGQSMTLTYDFGDSWRFDVKLESIDPAGRRLKKPRILDSHGEAPEQYPRWDD